MQPRKKKLLDQVRDKIRLKHYSLKTERSYIGWIKRYIVYHYKRHPLTMGKEEIEPFLGWLAADLTKRLFHTGYSAPPCLRSVAADRILQDGKCPSWRWEWRFSRWRRIFWC